MSEIDDFDLDLHVNNFYLNVRNFISSSGNGKRKEEKNRDFVSVILSIYPMNENENKK